MGDFDGLLQSALAHHRAGRLEEAASQYESALAVRPGDADALHYVGVVAHQRGEHEKAIELIARAIKARGEAPQMLCNLAEAQRAAGHAEDAETSCRRALALRADYPEAQINLAAALFQQKRFTDSEAAARAALQSRPDMVGAAIILADALREQRRLRDAEQAYRNVIALAPRNGDALTNLGWMLVQSGRMEEGLELCRRAAAENSDDALPLQNLGRALLEHGRLDEAMEALERALEREPNSPRSSFLIGAAWQELGDLPEARTWLERALQLDGDLVEARVRIAGLESEVDNHELAIEMLDAVLATDAQRIDALVARAKAKLSLGDVEGAVADQRSAIALHPEAAGLRAALGNILASAGDLEGAVACHREAIALNGQCVPAYAGLLATLRHRATEAERDAAIALLDASWITDKLRAALGFGLAAYYDGRREWARAAERMVEANALRKTSEEARHRDYEPRQYEAFVDTIIDTFDHALFTRLKGLGSDSERPVFIVGMPRSGTTLTEQILASHPSVFGAGERRFAVRGFARLPHLMGRTKADPLTCLADAGEREIHAVAEWHLARLASLDDGKAARIVDKMPDNFSMLGWLAILFPRARFIHCRRDARDVALSCWITNFTSIRWANDLEQMTQRILQYRRLMDHWQRVLPVPMLEIHYEALVSDQEGQSRRLIDWLGLEWDGRCLSFFKTERLVRTASVAQVRQPMYNRSIARWVHYEAMLAPLLERLGPPV